MRLISRYPVGRRIWVRWSPKFSALHLLRATIVFAAIVPGKSDRCGAAALASPGLAALLHGDAGYEQRRDRICPPESEERVGSQAHEQRCREVGAEHVLLTFA